MNLDALNDKWLSSQYSHVSLARMVINSCQTYNITQLVKGVTRTQFKLSTQSAEESCIDHIYTNFPDKCTKPHIISFGSSDHDGEGGSRSLRSCRSWIHKVLELDP